LYLNPLTPYINLSILYFPIRDNKKVLIYPHLGTGMEKDEIAMIAQDIILNFTKRVDKPLVLFLPKSRFSRHLDLMALQKHLSKTPCFTARMKGGTVIYFCTEIIAKLTKEFSQEMQRKFIEAITLHELLHLWNHLHVHTEDGALFSEKLVHQELRTFYPSHYKILQSFLHKAG
jgi:hypothetical protein